MIRLSEVTDEQIAALHRDGYRVIGSTVGRELVVIVRKR